MKNRFFFDGELNAGATVVLNADEAHHARVLRVRDGESVEVFNGRGAGFDGVFRSEGIRLVAPSPNREPQTAITLAMAVINLDKFELVLQKATELGVAAVIPLVTDRCEVRPERYRGKDERWKKIIFEAVKQSGRTRIPSLEAPASFENVIARPGNKIVFDADEVQSSKVEGGMERNSDLELRTSNFLLIGPEGGFSDDERTLAREHRCAFEQLGPRRLRAETAAIAATALTLLRHA